MQKQIIDSQINLTKEQLKISDQVQSNNLNYINRLVGWEVERKGILHMVKLLSLIGSIGLGASSATPLIESAKTIINQDESEINFADYKNLSTVWDADKYFSINENILRNQIIPNAVITALNEIGISNISNTDFVISNIISLSTGKPIDMFDINGSKGAGQVRLIFDIEATEQGNINGINGSTTMFHTINYAYGDLKQYEGQNLLPGRWFRHYDMDLLTNFMAQTLGQYIYELDKYHTAFSFAISQLIVNTVYIADSGVLLNQEYIDNMTIGEIIKINFILEPTVKGKELGILNSALLYSEFEKAEKPGPIPE